MTWPLGGGPLAIMWHIAAFYVGTLVTCTFAWLRGSFDERYCAACMIAATVLTRIAASEWERRFHAPEFGILLVDATMFAALTGLALKTRRFWPLWMAGLQGYGLVAHGARFLTPTAGPLMYAIGQGLMCYPMMLLLVIATIRHRDRQRSSG